MGNPEGPVGGLRGPLEREVMDVLWQLEQATVRDVHQQLSRRREVAYTTVLTTMARLADKGYLRRDTTWVAYRYRPALSRQTHARATVSWLLGWLIEHYPQPTVAYFAEVIEDFDEATVAELEAAVVRRRNHDT